MADNPQSTPDSIARTPTGEIKDQGQTTTPAATTPQTTTTPEPTATPETKADDKSLISQDGKSLANQTPAAGAPEAYAEFKVPEGYTLDTDVAKEASTIFKGLNLSQEGAQQLVDFYVGKTTEAVNAPYQLWQETQTKWVSEVKADPVLGRNLQAVTSSISKLIDHATQGNTKLAQDFRQAMDFTGAGNNPAFLRMFYEISKLVTEGSHVTGKGPSPAGQQRPGVMPSAAQAMYPNLPSSG